MNYGILLRVMWCCTGKDFICVQSMDGTVSVFEQESFSFSRFLPGTLLPGPIGYVAKTDSIVTVASSRQVDCFKCVIAYLLITYSVHYLFLLKGHSGRD